MIVKIYLENGAKMPTKAHDTDYGWDVCATTKEVKAQRITYGTGIHIAPQTDGKNVCIQAFPRSSIVNTGLVLSNGVGIVDSGYRGEVMAKFYQVVSGKTYDIGDRIIQIALSNGAPIEWEQVETLEELGTTDRGDGGYGSSGR